MTKEGCDLQQRHQGGAFEGTGEDIPLVLSDFDYAVPEALIAQEPLAARDASKLLLRSREGVLRHLHVGDLTSELPYGTLLILNDSKVFPSRIKGNLPTGGGVELFLLSSPENGDGSDASIFRALARPMKKLEVGTKITLGASSGDPVIATVLGRDADAAAPSVTVSFSLNDRSLYAWLDEHGFVPLPPYIKRPAASPASMSRDRTRYQTVYADQRGSVAAPTAGLHFTQSLLTQLNNHGIDVATVSLNVGAGTFLPVKTEDPADHRMHRERYFVGQDVAAKIVSAKREGRPIVAVGTTSFRSLEQLGADAAANAEDWLAEFERLAGAWRETALYIRPRTRGDRYRPRIVDGLMTNFHQPQSTLFMLIAALIGLDEAQSVYRKAIEAGYRLFSYGDSSFFWL